MIAGICSVHLPVSPECLRYGIFTIFALCLLGVVLRQFVQLASSKQFVRRCAPHFSALRTALT